MKSYAGIGSRETTGNILNLFIELGERLAKQGYTLRSGHADGADQAFEVGCDEVKGSKEIFIPWRGFNNSNSQLYEISDEAMRLVEKFHPYRNNLSDGAKKLQSRNCYQVLGLDLDSAVDFVICYTERGLGRGGTGQALRLAHHYNIPVFDVGKYNIESEMLHELELFLRRYMK